jgi:hypothetical protein
MSDSLTYLARLQSFFCLAEFCGWDGYMRIEIPLGIGNWRDLRVWLATLMLPQRFFLSHLVPISLNSILFPHSYKGFCGVQDMPVRHPD